MKTFIAAICKKHTRECVTSIETIKAKSIYDVAYIMELKYPDLVSGLKDGTLFVDVEQ